MRRVFIFLASMTSLYACNNSDFSGNSARQDNSTNTNSRKDADNPNAKSSHDDKNLDSKDSDAQKKPSLSQDRIDKTKWHGCCPVLQVFDMRANVDKNKTNWAAKVFTSVEPFRFEKKGSNDFDVTKQLSELYSDDECLELLPDSGASSFHIKTMHSPINGASAITDLTISGDGQKAQGFHSVINITNPGSNAIPQPVTYEIIEGKRLIEKILIEDKSIVSDNGPYESICEMTPI